MKKEGRNEEDAISMKKRATMMNERRIKRLKNTLRLAATFGQSLFSSRSGFCRSLALNCPRFGFFRGRCSDASRFESGFSVVVVSSSFSGAAACSSLLGFKNLRRSAAINDHEDMSHSALIGAYPTRSSICDSILSSFGMTASILMAATCSQQS